MYIDEDVKLRDDLPEQLQNEFAQLQKYYDADDWFNFDLFLEGTLVRAKSFYYAGKISRADLDNINLKYGISY